MAIRLAILPKPLVVIAVKSNGFGYVRLVRGGQSFDAFDAAPPISELIFADGFE